VKIGVIRVKTYSSSVFIGVHPWLKKFQAIEEQTCKRKNRVSQPEDGRKTRGIRNEHNVGLRRTRALVCTQDQAEIIKIKDQTSVAGRSSFTTVIPAATVNIKSSLLISVNHQNKV
jgi:hypothetical protein